MTATATMVGKATGEVLVLHASVGGGHKSAARAIARAFEREAPGVPVRVIDALDLVTPTFRAVYGGSFEASVAHAPGLWGAAFSLTRDVDRSPVLRAARALTNRVHGRALLDLLATSRPRAVVCTHFLPLELALQARAAGELDAPVIGVVTDYVTHGLWRQPEADLTVCAPGRARHDLRQVVPDGRVLACGIPIDPAFAEPYDRAVSKARAGLHPTRPTVALLAGGAGMGPLVEVLERTIASVGDAADLVVVCGKNEALRERARAVAAGRPQVKVVGFVDPIVELLRGADVVVTKPGGLTTSEVLALGKASVLYEAAPGQESWNARRAELARAAVIGGDPASTAEATARLVRDPAARAALEARALRIARPRAASDVVRAVLGKIEARAAARARERARHRQGLDRAA